MIILIRGLPGSGKSCLAAALPFMHLENDMLCFRNGTYKYDPEMKEKRDEMCENLAVIALTMAGESTDVVISNTFVSHAHMKGYVRYAVEKNTRSYIFKTTGNYGSNHDVRPEDMQAMELCWEDVQEEIVIPSNWSFAEKLRYVVAITTAPKKQKDEYEEYMAAATPFVHKTPLTGGQLDEYEEEYVLNHLRMMHCYKKTIGEEIVQESVIVRANPSIKDMHVAVTLEGTLKRTNPYGLCPVFPTLKKAYEYVTKITT